MAQKPAPAKPTEGDSSLGYPIMEQLLESEQFDAVNTSFSQGYEKLEKIMNDRSAGLKKQKEAEGSLKAYELTVELIKELLQIKREIVKNQQAQKGK